MVSPRSVHWFALITVPLSVMLSAGAGTSSAVTIALTPGMASAAAGVDAQDPRVRQGAEEQLAEQHALGAVVFGILRGAGDLRSQVGGRIVLADQLVLSARIQPRPRLRRFSAPRIIAVRILS